MHNIDSIIYTHAGMHAFVLAIYLQRKENLYT